MRDGETQAAIRLMEMKGATNAGKIYSEVNTRLQGSSDTMRRLMQDVIQKNQYHLHYTYQDSHNQM